MAKPVKSVADVHSSDIDPTTTKLGGDAWEALVNKCVRAAQDALKRISEARSRRVAAMPKVVAALGRLIPRHRGADRVPQHIACATARLSQDHLELRERVLDGIEVGAVFREEPQVGADVFNRPADGRTFVTRQVVHDDDVARGERRGDGSDDIQEM